MNQKNSLILERRAVSLSKAMQAVVEKMYGRAPLDQVNMEEITYLSDNLKVKGYMATPLGEKPEGGWPLLIWNRGGYGDRGSLDDLRATLILASTAAWGYMVLATQYRGNRGGEGREDWGDNDINDALNLIDVAKETGLADLSRIGIEGASRGGMSTYGALIRDDRFCCAIVHAGLSDLFALEEEKPQFAEWIDSQF
ncbi:MAG: prolyl oligopeptidase family serine peptidase, partial [bacterium]|nr:prolyl oligopeptidase family serine peptidase [bacterium]